MLEKILKLRLFFFMAKVVLFRLVLVWLIIYYNFWPTQGGNVQVNRGTKTKLVRSGTSRQIFS